MLHGLAPRCGIGVAERTIFVGMALIRCIREGIGIHGVEAETQRVGMVLQTLRVLLVPRNMQGDIRGRPCQLVDDGAIIQLVKNAAGLTFARKAGETGAAGADAPGWNSDEEFRDLGGDSIDIDVATRELVAQRIVVVLQRGGALVVFGRDHIGGDFGVGHLFLPGIGPVHARSSPPLSFRR
ncbi:hypothetical protein D3C71_1699070 [compost metagenome]